MRRLKIWISMVWSEANLRAFSFASLSYFQEKKNSFEKRIALTFGVVGRKEGLSDVLLSLLQPLLPPQLDGVNIGFLFHYSLERRLKVAALACAPWKVRLKKNDQNLWTYIVLLPPGNICFPLWAVWFIGRALGWTLGYLSPRVVYPTSEKRPTRSISLLPPSSRPMLSKNAILDKINEWRKFFSDLEFRWEKIFMYRWAL